MAEGLGDLFVAGRRHCERRDSLRNDAMNRLMWAYGRKEEEKNLLGVEAVL